MEAIDGIDLSKVDEQATQTYRKLVQARIGEYLKSLLLQEHNQRMKGERLRREADQADAQRAVLLDRIKKIRGGDWSSIEPFELSDKEPPKDKT